MKKIYNSAEMSIVALRHSDIIVTSPQMSGEPDGFGGFRGEIDNTGYVIGYGED